MITVIDLSSDDETPTTKEKSVAPKNTTTQEHVNKERLDQHCQISQQKLITIEIDSGNSNEEHYARMSDFIDHVVMVWLNRVRNGYRNLEMPNDILKSKAQEAACLLNVDDRFLADDWLKGFQEKIKQSRDWKQIINTGDSTIFRIEEIIKVERDNFFKNCSTNSVQSQNEEHLEKQKQLKEIEEKQQKQLSKMLEEQKKHLEKVRETQRQQMAQIKEAQKHREESMRKEMKTKIAELQATMPILKDVPPAQAGRKPEEIQIVEVRGAEPLPPPRQPVEPLEVIEVDDVLDEPIQSYDEALDCLSLVENYFLSTRNLKAVVFVNQIETFLKQQLNP